MTQASAAGKTQLARTLGLWAIVGLGLGYMTPTIVFDTFGIVSTETDNVVPAAYLMALVAMVFTAISYGRMTQVFPSAGSAYTYTSETMSPNLGFLIGWAALLAYLLLPRIHQILTALYVPDYFIGRTRTSDGLLGDLGHILRASGTGACIDTSITTDLIAISALPISARGQFDPELLHQCTLAGGDDYELAFTAPVARRAAVAAASLASSTPVTRIGRIEAEPGLRLVDAQGQPVVQRYASFDHFAAG